MGNVVKYERTLFEPEHEGSARDRAFLDKEVVPFHDAVGEGRDRRPRGLAQGRRAGPALLDGAEEYGGAGRRRTSATT